MSIYFFKEWTTNEPETQNKQKYSNFERMKRIMKKRFFTRRTVSEEASIDQESESWPTVMGNLLRVEQRLVSDD
jgi:hypothetical protein